MTNTIEKIQKVILGIFVFLFPIFFLSTTPEYYTTNKFYLMCFTALLLLALSTLSIIIEKKFEWKKSNFDGPALLFFLALLVSLVITSPNKISALYNPTFGPTVIFFLIVIFYYLSSLLKPKRIFSLLNASALIIAVFSVISLFEPLKNAGLPTEFAYLKSPYFSPVGSRFDLMLISLFMLVYWLVKIYSDIKKEEVDLNKIWYPSLSSIIYIVALGAAVFSIVKPLVPNFNFTLPTYKDSWFASVEILKGVLTALFGVGVDNYSSIFSFAKDVSFNQSQIWTINTINFSRSTLLHIFTTTGLLGLLGFLSLIFTGLKDIRQIEKNQKALIYPMFIFTVLVILLITPSLLVFFLFFLILSTVNYENSKNAEKSVFDLKNIAPFYVGIITILLFFIFGSVYFIGKSYASLYFANKAITFLNQGKLADSYYNQAEAVRLNKYNDGLRVNFSQTNMLVANTIIQTAQKRAEEKKEQQISLTDTEKQQVSQAIQNAISEAKAAVTLSPKKSSHWANLANIYSNLLNTTQGADVWAVSAYQRAINLDPKNPTYRVSLGSVYYVLKRYNDSTNMFSQAVALKSDYTNAHYNLAWSLYQQREYQQAVGEMENVLNLLTDKNSTDYKNASKNLDDFKKQAEAAQAAQQTEAGQQLNVPQTQQKELSPKIELPKSASPEAK
jgi:Flp pilus assembly protein TadD